MSNVKAIRNAQPATAAVCPTVEQFTKAGVTLGRLSDQLARAYLAGTVLPVFLEGVKVTADLRPAKDCIGQSNRIAARIRETEGLYNLLPAIVQDFIAAKTEHNPKSRATIGMNLLHTAVKWHADGRPAFAKPEKGESEKGDNANAAEVLTVGQMRDQLNKLAAMLRGKMSKPVQNQCCRITDELISMLPANKDE